MLCSEVQFFSFFQNLQIFMSEIPLFRNSSLKELNQPFNQLNQEFLAK